MTEYDNERELREIDEDEIMSENIKLKRILEDIEAYYFNWVCVCKNCIDIKNRIKEVK